MGCQGEHVQIIPIPLNLIDFLFCYWYNYLVIWGRTQVVEEFRLENVLPIWKSCCLKPLISWDFSGAMNLIICLVLPISSPQIPEYWWWDRSGDVPKWLKGPHSKCGRRATVRGFKSHHLRMLWRPAVVFHSCWLFFIPLQGQDHWASLQQMSA